MYSLPLTGVGGWKKSFSFNSIGENRLIKLLAAFILIGCLTQCTVIKEGEVGVKRKLGKYSDKPYDEGLKLV